MLAEVKELLLRYRLQFLSAKYFLKKLSVIDYPAFVVLDELIDLANILALKRYIKKNYRNALLYECMTTHRNNIEYSIFSLNSNTHTHLLVLRSLLLNTGDTVTIINKS